MKFSGTITLSPVQEKGNQFLVALLLEELWTLENK